MMLDLMTEEDQASAGEAQPQTASDGCDDAAEVLNVKETSQNKLFWFCPAVLSARSSGGGSLASSPDKVVVVTHRGYSNQSKWGMAGLNGLVIMGREAQ